MYVQVYSEFYMNLLIYLFTHYGYGSHRQHVFRQQNLTDNLVVQHANECSHVSKGPIWLASESQSSCTTGSCNIKKDQTLFSRISYVSFARHNLLKCDLMSLVLYYFNPRDINLFTYSMLYTLLIKLLQVIHTLHFFLNTDLHLMSSTFIL